MVSAYDRLGRRYDAWCRSVTEDIPFYVDLALHAGGPVLEVGVGSGRIAVPTALAGVPVVGVDSSAVMLDLARQRAAPHASRCGWCRPICATCRSWARSRSSRCRSGRSCTCATMPSGLAVLRALHARLQPGGTLAFDVFHPDGADITETHDRWIEREPGIEERAHWDEAGRSLTLSVRAGDVEAAMQLWWVGPDDWRRLLAEAGFERIESYGWFDKRPLEADSTDSAWLAHRPTGG